MGDTVDSFSVLVQYIENSLNIHGNRVVATYSLPPSCLLCATMIGAKPQLPALLIKNAFVLFSELWVPLPRKQHIVNIVVSALLVDLVPYTCGGPHCHFFCSHRYNDN